MSILQSGYKRREKTDRNGKGYIEAPELGMPAALNRLISVDKWIDGFTTSYGPGRMALQVEFAQAKYKVIVNAEPVKNFFRDMDVIGVTKVQTVFIDTGGRHYDVDLARTEVLEIDNRHVTFDQRTGLYVFDGTSDTFDLGKAMADIQRSKGEAGLAADAK